MHVFTDLRLEYLSFEAKYKCLLLTLALKFGIDTNILLETRLTNFIFFTTNLIVTRSWCNKIFIFPSQSSDKRCFSFLQCLITLESKV